MGSSSSHQIPLTQPAHNSLPPQRRSHHQVPHLTYMNVLFFQPFPDDFTEQQITDTIIRPGFQLATSVKCGKKYSYNNYIFKITHSYPPEGVVRDVTRITYIGNTLHRNTALQKVHVVPFEDNFVLSSVPPPSGDDLWNNYISNLFLIGRHLLEGEILYKDDKKYLVLSCTPSDGVISPETEIRIDGNPVKTINLIKISIKSNIGVESISSEDVMNYLRFGTKLIYENTIISIGNLHHIFIENIGRRMYSGSDGSNSGGSGGRLSGSCRIEITGNQFSDDFPSSDDLIAINYRNPNNNEAQIYHIRPAFRNQRVVIYCPNCGSIVATNPSVENQNMNIICRCGTALSIPNTNRNLQIGPPFLRNESGQSIAMSPEDIMRMTLARFDGLEIAFRNRQAELNQIRLQQQHFQQRNNTRQSQGLSSRQIELFPVRKYIPIESNETELTQCPICLCDYESGDDIRTLPCFHYFHVCCIDSWLNQHSVCPLCKNDVHHYDMY